MSMSETQSRSYLRPGSAVTQTGAGLILVTGLVHLVLTPAHLEEATYLGLLFLANFVGAAVAAFGISRRLRWGWALGALAAGGAYALYFVDGTVGLPGVEGGHLIEPLGLFAKVVEAVFLILCAFVLTRGLATSARQAAVVIATVAALAVLPIAALALTPDDAEDGHPHENGHHQNGY